VHTVARLDNVYAVILGALTFMIATVGIKDFCRNVRACEIPVLGAVGGDRGGEGLEQHDAAAAGLLRSDPPKLAVTVTLVGLPGRLGDEDLVHSGGRRGSSDWDWLVGPGSVGP